MVAVGKWFARSQDAFRLNDSFQFVYCPVQDFVDENIAVFVVIHNLLLSILKSSLYYFRVHLVSLAAAAESPFERLAVWWHDEDAHRLRNFLANLLGALDINIEQQVLAFCLRILEKTAGRPVVVAENFGVFEETVFRNHLLKFSTRYEVVFTPILLAASRWSGGVGDREIKIRNDRAQFVHQR